MSFFLFLFSFTTNAQSSNIDEKNNIKFQHLFFKALSQKALFNHKKAIEYLKNCNELLPNNEAVFFEISKNNLKLARSVEALEYIELALNIAPNNLWMLEHKVRVLRKTANFNEAIKVQEKIAKIHPKKKQELVYLHLQNRDIISAKKVLSELKEAKLLNSTLRKIQDKLNNTKPKVHKTEKKTVPITRKTAFEKEKSYNNLKLLLDELTLNNNTDLLKYSEQGLTLFPAQPFIYLINGKALNYNKQYKKALQSLQNGIDFVIDNTKMEAKFYLEMAKAYKGLNNSKKANFFKNKATKILK